MYREGSMIVQGEPYFIARQIVTNNANGINNNMIMIFDVSKDMWRASDKRVIRKAYKKVIPESPYTGTTTLSKLAQKAISKQEPYYVDLPDKYTVPVVPGMGTNRGEEDLGFYERDVNGEPTGVFITLNDIQFDEWKVDTDSIVQLATEYNNSAMQNAMGQDGFYNLQ